MTAAKKKSQLPKSNKDWKIDPKDAAKEIKTLLRKPVKKRKEQAANPAPAEPATEKNKKSDIKKETGTGKHPGGAPSKYDENSHPLMVWVLAVLGKTNIQIASELTISSKTLHEWGKKHPEFLSSVKAGKAIANARVVKALYNRAIGYKTTEKKVIQNPDNRLKKEVTEKDIIPDVGAIKLWLINRDPDHWQDKVDHELTTPDGKPILVKVLRAVSMEDL